MSEQNAPLRYLVIGAGALGSTLTAYLTAAGKSVTIIARGDHLAALRSTGLVLNTPTVGTAHEQPMGSALAKGEVATIAVDAVAEADYIGTPDVVFVAVKHYSLSDVIPLIDRVTGPEAVVIPLLNALACGDTIAAGLSGEAQVAEGLAYIGAERPRPGEIVHKMDFFRVVLGARRGFAPPAVLPRVAQDLIDSGLSVELSDDMLSSALTKMVRVSTLSAAMIRFEGTAGTLAASPEAMAYLSELCAEIVSVGEATGSPLQGDPVGEVLEIVPAVFPEYRTSLKEDVDNGRPAEVRSQIVDVYELGSEMGCAMPAYRQAVEYARDKGLV